jgi:hypothetical protein
LIEALRSWAIAGMASRRKSRMVRIEIALCSMSGVRSKATQQRRFIECLVRFNPRTRSQAAGLVVASFCGSQALLG